MPFFALASVVELVALHALVQGLWPGHPLAHVALFAVHVYGVLWLVGDRWWLARTAHVLEDDVLRLRLGLRAEAEIPLASVQRALPLKDDRQRRRVQPRRGRNVRITPLDLPNVHLCLSMPCRVRGLFGRVRHAQHLDLFVDRPEQFLEALSQRARAAHA